MPLTFFKCKLQYTSALVSPVSVYLLEAAEAHMQHRGKKEKKKDNNNNTETKMSGLFSLSGHDR